MLSALPTAKLIPLKELDDRRPVDPQELAHLLERKARQIAIHVTLSLAGAAGGFKNSSTDASVQNHRPLTLRAASWPLWNSL
jgi:hypothetical protein